MYANVLQAFSGVEKVRWYVCWEQRNVIQLSLHHIIAADSCCFETATSDTLHIERRQRGNARLVYAPLSLGRHLGNWSAAFFCRWRCDISGSTWRNLRSKPSLLTKWGDVPSAVYALRAQMGILRGKQSLKKAKFVALTSLKLCPSAMLGALPGQRPKSH